jgi:hypothetical protein
MLLMGKSTISTAVRKLLVITRGYPHCIPIFWKINKVLALLKNRRLCQQHWHRLAPKPRLAPWQLTRQIHPIHGDLMEYYNTYIYITYITIYIRSILIVYLSFICVFEPFSRQYRRLYICKICLLQMCVCMCLCVYNVLLIQSTLNIIHKCFYQTLYMWILYQTLYNLLLILYGGFPKWW